MNEQNQDPPAPDGNEFFTNSPAVSNHREPRRKRCAHCGKPFGLIRRHSAGMQFCSVQCMDKQAEGVRKAVEAKARWYRFLQRR
jgi:hypothetical protein